MKSWRIVYGTGSAIEEKALQRLYPAVYQYVNGQIACVSADEATESDLKDFNLIFMGTEKSNSFLKGVAQKEYVAEGYTLIIEKSKFNSENQMVLICGEDESGVLYGCADFRHKYLANEKNNHNSGDYFKKLFDEPFTETNVFSAPAVKNRGLWSWGYVVYDYKGYIDNMAELKLNTLTLWNDYPPVNAKEIIEYAHSLGVKVIWGYSWLWDNGDISLDISNLDGYVQGIVDTYEKCYAHLGGDGIYFQTFTETADEYKNGVPIAEAAVDFVNKVSAKILEKYPDLMIQFGLHATSVKNRLSAFENLDKRVSIVWEDCGAFPYAYCPNRISDADETARTTDELMRVTDGDNRFGVVLKGLICLNWPSFVHQEGVFVLGEHSRQFTEAKAEEKKEIWRYVQAYWIRNSEYALNTIRQMCNEKEGKLTVSALVEDGAFCKNIWYPTAIFAEMLWSPDSDVKDIMCNVALRDDVVFA